MVELEPARKNEIVDPHFHQADLSLRPRSFKEYIGQEALKEKLKLFIDAALERGEALDHVLLAGPPGLGKTTLAHLIAIELKSDIHIVSGPNVEKKGDLAAILTNLKPKDVLFIDEIHRLPKPIEEVLYSAMEDFKIDIIIGQGPAARTLKIDVAMFTLVGATTRSGLLSNPLRDRFGVQLRLDFYPMDEIEKIISRSAEVLDVDLAVEGSNEIALRSRGTPRIANRLLKRVRDFAQVKSKGKSIDRSLAQSALELFEVDHKGLDALDRKILTTIIDTFSGGPIGIETLASALSEDVRTLEEVYEPYLVQQGFILRTPRGRMAAPAAYAHMGFPTA